MTKHLLCKAVGSVLLGIMYLQNLNEEHYSLLAWNEVVSRSHLGSNAVTAPCLRVLYGPILDLNEPYGGSKQTHACKHSPTPCRLPQRHMADVGAKQ